MSNLSAAQSNLENLENQSATLSPKQEAGRADSVRLRGQRTEAVTKLNNTERAHILDKATDEELEAAQKHVDDIDAKLAATDRRNTLIGEELKKLDTEILKTQQAVKIVKSEFCISRRNAIFNEIQNDQKLKAKLLEALAAFALNGHIPYTTDRAKFFEMFARNFLPEFAEAEVTQAAEKFRRDNQLD